MASFKETAAEFATRIIVAAVESNATLSPINQETMADAGKNLAALYQTLHDKIHASLTS